MSTGGTPWDDTNQRARDAYLYARYNGQDDKGAADFVQWYGEDAHRMLMVHDAFTAWEDEVINVQKWERELGQ